VDVILVTGANGFVGSSLTRRLIRDSAIDVVAAVRSSANPICSNLNVIAVGDLSPTNDWSQALAGVTMIVHTAARVHIIRNHDANPLAEYRFTNVEGTLNLARQAARSGVKRFVFISSIKVNGEQTFGLTAYTPDDVPSPRDPYAISKMEAEYGLRDLAMEGGMDVVIVRPPLVYGTGAKANFRALMLWLHRGIPLPLGAIHNLRSLVALDNLVDMLVTCLMHPLARNQTFLVSDDEDVSTTELLTRLARALNRSARLIPVPERLLTLVATLLGGKSLSQRLCGSLRVDISKTRRLLGWSPVVTVDEGLRRAAEGFLREARF
jgi:nucleoside-diphosphate-sugar epimerase